MLSGMSISNFKAFGSRSDFELSPITLIYGENSAGKSSIIQALLGLSQSLVQREPFSSIRDISRPFETFGNRADLGTARDVVFQRNTANKIELKFLLDQSRARSAHGPDETIPNHFIHGVGWDFQATTGTSRQLGERAIHYYTSEELQIPLLSRPLRDGHGTTLRAWEVPAEHPLIRESYFGRKMDKHLNGIRAFGREILRVAEKYIEEFPKTTVLKSSSDIASMINVVMWEGRSNRGGENYRPRMRIFRESLRRALDSLTDYTIEDFAADTSYFVQIHSRGRFSGNWLRELHQMLDENQVNTVAMRRILVLAAVEDRQSGWPVDYVAIQNSVRQTHLQVQRDLRNLKHIGPARQRSERLTLATSDPTDHITSDGSNVAAVLANDPELVARINRTLDSIGVPYELSVWKIEQDFSDDLFSLQLTDTRTKTRVSMLDVGFGISQLIPIVVQLEIARNSILLIEQPELHLHPRQQADLGSLCLRSYLERQNQVILETHSEQIILRIQRLVRENRINHLDVCVLYVVRDNDGSSVLRLNIDQDGDFTDAWPGGFFEDGLSELLGLGGMV